VRALSPAWIAAVVAVALAGSVGRTDPALAVGRDAPSTLASGADATQGAFTIPLEPYFRGLRSVEVVIEGKPYHFLFDTGGGRTAISPEVVSAIGCKPRGRDVGYRMSGEPVSYAECDSVWARVGGLTFRIAPVAVLDLATLLPPELPKLDGMLALDVFRGCVITIDWAGSLLTVRARTGSEPSPESCLPVRIATGDTGSSLTVLVPAKHREQRFWMLLDSGDIAGTLVSDALLDSRELQPSPDSTLAIAVGDLPSAPLPFLRAKINYDGVLGTAFLTAYRITLDLSAAPGPRAIVATANAPARSADDR